MKKLMLIDELKGLEHLFVSSGSTSFAISKTIKTNCADEACWLKSAIPIWLKQVKKEMGVRVINWKLNFSATDYMFPHRLDDEPVLKMQLSVPGEIRLDNLPANMANTIKRSVNKSMAEKVIQSTDMFHWKNICLPKGAKGSISVHWEMFVDPDAVDYWDGEYRDTEEMKLLRKEVIWLGEKIQEHLTWTSKQIDLLSFSLRTWENIGLTELPFRSVRNNFEISCILEFKWAQPVSGEFRKALRSEAWRWVKYFYGQKNKYIAYPEYASVGPLF